MKSIYLNKVISLAFTLPIQEYLPMNKETDAPLLQRQTSIPSDLQLELARKVLLRLQTEGACEGLRLSVPEQARVFGVSRSPMSGALSLLSQAGVLRPAVPRGLELACDTSGMDVDALFPASPLETLYRRVMYDRATGRIPQEISETELMPRYDLSRGMVRKLLMRFSAEGLAQRQPGHGWRFADTLDEESENESYEIRQIVECAALTSSRFKFDPYRAAIIRRAHERLMKDGSGTDGNAWFQVNADFHEGLASFSRNRFAVELVRQQNNLRRMGEAATFDKLPMERVLQSCEEHLAILAAAESGDRDWAAALLQRHLQGSARFKFTKPSGLPT